MSAENARVLVACESASPVPLVKRMTEVFELCLHHAILLVDKTWISHMIRLILSHPRVNSCLDLHNRYISACKTTGITIVALDYLNTDRQPVMDEFEEPNPYQKLTREKADTFLEVSGSKQTS